jgi:hypothetical protein
VDFSVDGEELSGGVVDRAGVVDRVGRLFQLGDGSWKVAEVYRLATRAATCKRATDVPPTSQIPATLATCESMLTDSLNLAVANEATEGIGSAYARKDETA